MLDACQRYEAGIPGLAMPTSLWSGTEASRVGSMVPVRLSRRPPAALRSFLRLLWVTMAVHTGTTWHFRTLTKPSPFLHRLRRAMTSHTPIWPRGDSYDRRPRGSRTSRLVRGVRRRSRVGNRQRRCPRLAPCWKSGMKGVFPKSGTVGHVAEVERSSPWRVVRAIRCRQTGGIRAREARWLASAVSCMVLSARTVQELGLETSIG